MRAGIATIYQELDLVDDLSVAENAFLGHEPHRAGFVRRSDSARRTRTSRNGLRSSGAPALTVISGRYAARPSCSPKASPRPPAR